MRFRRLKEGIGRLGRGLGCRGRSRIRSGARPSWRIGMRGMRKDGEIIGKGFLGNVFF
jgi:hypothetical protein